MKLGGAFMRKNILTFFVFFFNLKKINYKKIN